MKRKYVIALSAAAVILIIVAVMAYQQQQARIDQVRRPEHRDRYYDTAAVRQVVVKTDQFIATASGSVINNTWKTRDVRVWAGFVKSDGFHEGSVAGRYYHSYQDFSQMVPNEKRDFSITFALPPVNRSYSAVAEFDPKPERLRPIWIPQ